RRSSCNSRLSVFCGVGNDVSIAMSERDRYVEPRRSATASKLVMKRRRPRYARTGYQVCSHRLGTVLVLWISCDCPCLRCVQVFRACTSLLRVAARSRLVADHFSCRSVEPGSW
ncbi:unnamed protein product, partial [Ectocarpus sp. 12 AP-2014]